MSSGISNGDDLWQRAVAVAVAVAVGRQRTAEWLDTAVGDAVGAAVNEQGTVAAASSAAVGETPSYPCGPSGTG